MIAEFKFKLYFDNSSLMVVCTNDPKKESRKELDLVPGFNSGEINNIKNLPIESGWKKVKFKYDFTEKDGQDFGMISERDLQNWLKRDPELHNKVHLFTNTKDGQRYWSVFFSQAYLSDLSSNYVFLDISPENAPSNENPESESKSCTVMFKSRKSKSKSSKKSSKRRSKSSKKSSKKRTKKRTKKEINN